MGIKVTWCVELIKHYIDITTCGKMALSSATAALIFSAQGTKVSRPSRSCMETHNSWMRLVT
jgi:hypothetical protein